MKEKSQEEKCLESGETRVLDHPFQSTDLEILACKLVTLTYVTEKNYIIESNSYSVSNICNQGTTLCSPSISSEFILNAYKQLSSIV